MVYILSSNFEDEKGHVVSVALAPGFPGLSLCPSSKRSQAGWVTASGGRAHGQLSVMPSFSQRARSSGDTSRVRPVSSVSS